MQRIPNSSQEYSEMPEEEKILGHGEIWGSDLSESNVRILQRVGSEDAMRKIKRQNVSDQSAD